MTNKKGFTLIELLIVIAIIGILAAALIPNILNAPAAARDTARVSAMQDVVTALEQYYTATGNYPTNGGCLNKANYPGLTQYFKGLDFPNPSGSAMSGTCASPFWYVKLNSPYNYAIVATMEKSGTDVKKYTGKSPISFTTAQDSQAVITAPGNAGSNYMYVIQ